MTFEIMLRKDNLNVSQLLKKILVNKKYEYNNSGSSKSIVFVSWFSNKEEQRQIYEKTFFFQTGFHKKKIGQLKLAY